LKKKSSENDEVKIRKYLIELGKRTTILELRDSRSQAKAGDADYVQKKGDEIANLIHEGSSEKARELIEMELNKNPDELRFMNLMMILEMFAGPIGDYSKARSFGTRVMDAAVGKNRPHYVQAALTNLGIIAQREGLDDYSKVLYLAAHFIDKDDINSLQNLASWEARRNNLDRAQKYIDSIIDVVNKTCTNWVEERQDIVDWLLKDSSLSALRSDYQPFQQKVINKIRTKKNKPRNL
jgi:tetratricopeptide (TPR) repeat protein